ncbi:polyprenyl synthetase family protein [Georgenia sp. MJ173]|uniref:polyprenyl synthetase family protein n=1 Tax=Georgenia sunbinii TaxID=3117728 RepID=UPI002F260022
MPVAIDVVSAVSSRLATAFVTHTAPFTHLEGITELFGAGEALLSGGKRLRAQFCVAGWRAFGGAAVSAQSPAVLAGSALELFQGAALAHDDLMDGSLTRRGLPAAHRRFAAEHAERGWLGSSESHGAAGAILLGDLLLSISSTEMDVARAELPAEASHRARTEWDLMTAEVAVGQFLDVRSQVLPWQHDDEAVERALTVVRHKSARYSVEHPLVLGAALAGADDAALERLRGVGLPLGVAFQLRDDVLGVFGDPAVTGKPAGDDLREGKRTVLLALALRHADDAQRTALEGAVGRDDLGDDEVEEIRAILHETGAVDAHEDLIAAQRDAGLAALAAMDLAAESRDVLTELAVALTSRQA